MKLRLLLSFIIIGGCNGNEQKTSPIPTDTSYPTPTLTQAGSQPDSATAAPKLYSNKRFKDVSCEKISDNKFRIRGEGQIFEANFGWVVEDGHDELYKGFQMTTAGAPDWGKFDFTIDAKKKRENSTLTLVLFESSAEDGSRQHELPIAMID